MHKLSLLVSFLLASYAVPSVATDAIETVSKDMSGYDVVILGETHDNLAHHDHQRAFVGSVQPRAIVWEMLTQNQADKVTKALIADKSALETVLDWENSGWPAFDMYYPVFQAMPGAVSYGGHLPRAKAREAFETGITTAFGRESKVYGLTDPLPKDEQTAREAAQMRAHCDAMPTDLLPNMVDIQRLRDAILARSVIKAFAETGGPVVVITGTGHARKDWGVPVYLARVMPDLTVYSLGQSEDGHSVGMFDHVLDSPKVDRDDPCAAFKDKG